MTFKNTKTIRSYQVDFQPGAWSQHTLTDCYAYALNLPKIGSNRFGRLFSTACESIDISSVAAVQKAASVLDGLAVHTEIPRDASHLIAAFWGAHAHANRPGVLFLRRDSNNQWSYLYADGRCSADKPPTQLDFSGQVITDLNTCDLGKYDTLVGVYSVPYEGLVIEVNS